MAPAPPRPRGTGSARSSTSARPPSSSTAKWSIGSASEPSKWKRLPVSLLDLEDRGLGPGHQLGGHLGVHRDQERLGVGALGGQLAQLALGVDRHRLLGEHHALALAGGAGLGEDLAHALGHVLAGHLHQAERRDLHHVGLGAVLVERLAQLLEHRVAVARARHVDEVDDDDPADVAQPQLAHALLGGLEVGLDDRVLEPGALAAAGERAGVDVDHRHRLGVVDDQVAAARAGPRAGSASTGSPPRRRSARTAAPRPCTARAASSSSGAVRVKKDSRRWCCWGSSTIARSNWPEKMSRATRTDRSASWKTIAGAAVSSARLLQHLVQLVQVLDLALEVLLLAALGRGADDRAASLEVDLGRRLAQPVALLVRQPARHARRPRRRARRPAAARRSRAAWTGAGPWSSAGP